MTPLGGPWPSLLHPFSQRVLALPPGVLLLFVVWSLVWKGLALWRAGRVGQPVWFVVLLVVNTGGLLEIVYLAFFAPRHAPVPGRARPAPGGPATAGPEPGGAHGGAGGEDGDARS